MPNQTRWRKLNWGRIAIWAALLVYLIAAGLLGAIPPELAMLQLLAFMGLVLFLALEFALDLRNSRRWQLTHQLLTGLAMLGFLAWVVSIISGRDWLISFAAVTLWAAIWMSLVMAWLLHWARNSREGRGQFSLASAGFAVCLFSLVLGVAQWLATALVLHTEPSLLVRLSASAALVALTALLAAVVTTILLPMVDSLVWIAAAVLKARRGRHKS